ncbi:MAG TPA: hypothetical protein PLG33_08040 [Prolixibacteraceae bacterium]|nr:hypothetical protein [Prolixibacteraceae bacterium]
MNSGKNILLNILLVFLILFCTELERKNYAPTGTVTTEFCTDQNNDNLQANTDSDVFDDDHFSVHREFAETNDHLSVLPVANHQNTFSGFTDSGFRPPKFL